MSKYAGEKVLVVRRSLFDEIGEFHGILTGDIDPAIARLLEPENHFFMDRGTAEEDPSHKQLIPYCVFRCGDKILHYTRGKAGGESRLHAKISVGVGGHINPIDTGDGRTGPEAYFAAVARAMGGEGHEVSDRAGLEAALRRALAAESFSVIACRIPQRSYDGRI